MSDPHTLSPKIKDWVPTLMPLVRAQIGWDASSDELMRATVEAALWAHPETRPALIEAAVDEELDRIDEELDCLPSREPREKWFLRDVINDAMADVPDDLTTG